MPIRGRKPDFIRKTPLRAMVIAALLSALVPLSAALCEAASLDEVVVTNTRDHLLVYFTVKDCFTGEMVKAIESGLPMTFTFFVKLYEVRRFWWDREIADLKVQHQIRYDDLKKIYHVQLMEKQPHSVQTTDFEKAKGLMSEIVGLRVVELRGLEKGTRYRVHLMAELDKIRLPFYLHYVFFFLSLWDFETDWYKLEFTY